MPSDHPTSLPALSAKRVIKRYGKVPVLRGIDLEIRDGSAFGLVGLNGAGKTTLIKCLLDFCSIDGGSISIFGVPHIETASRSRIAFVPERFVPPHYLTGREFMQLTFALTGEKFDADRVERLFDELGLERDVLSRPVRQLSKGMTQKLGLAGSFAVDRSMYVLDEPMSGLDPASRVAVKMVLARMTRENRTLFFTSHVLADVEELCTSIAILDGGKIRFQGHPRELCERYSESHLERAFMRCINGSDTAIAA